MKILEQINLSGQEREAIRKAADSLKSMLPVSTVILFGSKARGTAGPESDIDLLVLTRCDVDEHVRQVISEQLSVINLEYEVELTAVAVNESQWESGVIRYSLIHSEVEVDGCVV